MTRLAVILMIIGSLLFVVGIGLAIDVPAAMMTAGLFVLIGGVLNLDPKKGRRS